MFDLTLQFEKNSHQELVLLQFYEQKALEPPTQFQKRKNITELPTKLC